MITAAVLDIITLLIGSLVDALPVIAVPGWLGSAGGYIPTVMSYAASMGVWFPWDVLGIVLASVFAVWGGSFILKIARIIISHLTGGGGSAS